MHTDTMTSKRNGSGILFFVAFTGMLLFSPLAFADDVQIFPPQPPAGTPCPQGSAAGLLWDGIHNVECVNVPTCNTALGQGLTFDGAKFTCVTPCIPQPTTITSGTCPPGETGAPASQPAVLNCDGTITPTSSEITNTCQVFVPAFSAVACTPGQIMMGYLDANGTYYSACGGSNPPCVAYICTSSGLVLPQNL